jgi:hypothetical protein
MITSFLKKTDAVILSASGRRSTVFGTADPGLQASDFRNGGDDGHGGRVR